jgi:feruloyl esterase
VATTAQQPVAVAVGSFQVAYSNPNWDWRTFTLDRDLKVVEERLGSILNALDADLSAFKARGGKLLLFHGWNDTLIPPRNTISYYSSVLDRMGPSQRDWMRLFMAPGMNHCTGGVGPDRVDWLRALEEWREGNRPPDRIVAARQSPQEETTLRRPLCPYPQLAVYKGTGSTNDPENFVCRNQ